MQPIQISPSPSTDESMTLYEALEHLERGTLPPVKALSASEAVASLLGHADNEWSGWRLTSEAREQLVKVLEWLRRKDAQGE